MPNASPVGGVPGTVVGAAVLSRDGSRAVLSVESPHQPRRLFELGVSTRAWVALTEPSFDGQGLVVPTRARTAASPMTGLAVEGWLYRAAGPGPEHLPPAVVYLHGGPEAQERPVFSPQHQLLAAAGITVFAPNIRGSAGYGRHVRPRRRPLRPAGRHR